MTQLTNEGKGINVPEIKGRNVLICLTTAIKFIDAFLDLDKHN